MPAKTQAKLAAQLAEAEPRVRVIYVSTYIPRECGIATYTKDLTNAINLLNPHYLADIVAIDDSHLNQTSYTYPWEVKYKIQQDDPESWLAAAEYINQSGADVVHLQHEFGIYSSNSANGEHVIPFMEAIKKPIVVTFHTVLPEPTPIQKKNVQKIAKKAYAITVMVEAAVHWLVSVYGVDEGKVVVIPHGVPDITFNDSKRAKQKLGLANDNILMSFGLISQGKGYEYVIEALPIILKKHPKTKLMILGETHPVVKRKEGEVYREKLHNLAKNLGVNDSVIYVNRYLDLDEIIEYLKATDIYLTPFLGLDQITSGTLSYAVGAGKVCVSTPYLYAKEVINGDRGRLVPPRDSQALGNTIVDLLDDPKGRHEMSKRAYDYGRNMIWPSVALSHLDLFEILKDANHAKS